jgi:hypothetical protein
MGRAYEGKSGMSKQQPDIIIEPENFRLFLMAWRGQHGSMAECAAKLGVSQKLIYMLLSGDRKPSAAILKKLGLEVVYRVKLSGEGKK